MWDYSPRRLWRCFSLESYVDRPHGRHTHHFGSSRRALCGPKCDYNLTGSTEPRCPECGQPFDPEQLRVGRSWWKRQPSWRVTLTAALLSVYLPNTWIFWISYPWQGGYRWHWVKMFPVLPTLLPGAWLSQVFRLRNTLGNTGGYVVLGVLTLGVVVMATMLGRRSRRWLLSVCALVLILEVFNALASHALFRA